MDLRVERTKRNIINAFLELRAKKSLEKITIKELSELAYINKATFYLHYKDIYDLSEQLEEELISSIIKNIPQPDNFIYNPKLATTEISLALASQKALIDILFSGSRAPILEQKISAIISQQIFDLHPELKNNLEFNIIQSTLLHGCFHSSMEYHTNDNYDEVIQIIGEINSCLLTYFTEKNSHNLFPSAHMSNQKTEC